MSQAPATATPTSFPLFPRLPVELQLIIWEFVVSAVEQVPEVHIAWLPFPTSSLTQLQPWLVNTGWPATAHVCRTSREALLKSGHLRLRYSPVAGFPVPFRAFNPAIDTLYWQRSQAMAMTMFFARHANSPLVRSLRHIAVEYESVSGPLSLAHDICDPATSLRTFSVVLPESFAGHPTTTRVTLPTRRFRLCDITMDGQNGGPLGEPACPAVLYAQSFLKDIKAIEQRYNYGAPGGTQARVAWTESLRRVEIKAQRFVVYATSEENGPQWVDMCTHCGESPTRRSELS